MKKAKNGVFGHNIPVLSGFFLSGIGEFTPPPPLTENHPAQIPLAERGATPPLQRKKSAKLFLTTSLLQYSGTIFRSRLLCYMTAATICVTLTFHKKTAYNMRQHSMNCHNFYTLLATYFPSKSNVIHRVFLSFTLISNLSKYVLGIKVPIVKFLKQI